jgi:hypothetical protein
MRLPDQLTSDQHAALVACLRIFALRGRSIREEREREQKAQSAERLGGGAADWVEKAHGGGISTERTEPYAT